MVVVFLLPVLAGIGVREVRAVVVHRHGAADGRAVRGDSGRARLASITLLLVNVFPARRARDILMLMGLVFAISIVLLLRFLQPERLLRVESMPEVTDFFATLQSPITPLLPSFWAGEALFAGLQGGRDLLHIAALWSTAAAAVVVVGWAFRALALRRIQQGAGSAQGAVHAVAHARSHRRTAAAVAGAKAPADQGPQGVPARRQPVVAAAAAAGADDGVSLQLPRARSRAHPVHERLPEEHLRVPQPGDGRRS